MTPTHPETDPPDPGSGARKRRPLIFGEVLFDHFPDGRRVLGGAPFNVAWHLEAFGADPLMVSAVGNDADGRDVLDEMEGWGLDTSGVQVDEEGPTGRVEVTVSEGQPHFEIPPDQVWDALDPEALRETVPAGSVDLLYHGTLALRSEENWRTLRDLVRTTGAPTFVDLNLRDPWVRDDRVDWCLSRATWVKLNDVELGRLTGAPTGSVEECRRAAWRLRQKHGIARLIITLGERGSLSLAEGGRALYVESARVPDMVDTVGAGDAFSAVCCLGILNGWNRESTLERASRFAAEICGVQGATSGDLTLYERHIRDWIHDPGEERTFGGRRPPGLHIMSLSVHGLVRGRDIELGRDADTGGQISYVIDQAKALVDHPDVESVDVVTRLIQDRNVDEDYARPREDVADGVRILRMPFGPRRYLHKESLWPYLDSLLDQLIRHIRTSGRVPDVVHGHYADAGYVGAQLAKLLGVPFVFTGHSLGRVKKARLLAEGADEETLEERYHFVQRIEAEEQALETAALVITSTNQEVRDQYQRYDDYHPRRMEVIPPGVDVSRFSPPPLGWRRPPVAAKVTRFLRDPGKPMILALARADERKNFAGLVRAYAETSTLRRLANLVLIAGNRDDIAEMPAGSRRVLTGILMLVDRYDLYGSVAYPKRHEPEDVPDLYRMAARSRGVFVNPALTEPFGLTLLEAAASGLPVVATNDGGPRDILAACRNGLLVDPLDSSRMGAAIQKALTSRKQWGRWSKSGVSGVHASFSWTSHARRYVREVRKILAGERPAIAPIVHSRILRMDRLLVTDIDDTLVGDDEALEALIERLMATDDRVGFGIATGRSIGQALAILEEMDVPTPDVLITSSGGQLHYGRNLIRDRSWERQIAYRWDPEALHEFFSLIPGLSTLKKTDPSEHRLRYRIDPKRAPGLPQLRRAMRKLGLHATTILDRSKYLDVLPVRASPGLAIRFFCFKWEISPERLLVAGDSGNDVDMLSGDTLGVVVGNHAPELEALRGRPRVYFADGEYARGILEGIEWYDFFGTIRSQDVETAEETG